MPPTMTSRRVRLALLTVLLAALSAIVAPLALAQNDPGQPSTTAVEPSATSTTDGPTTEPSVTSTSPSTSTTTTTERTTTTEAPPTSALTSTPVEGTPTTLPTGPPPGFTEEQFRTFVNVVGACGSDPGTICQRLYDWTGNRTFAQAVQWGFDVPLAALLVVFLAFLANWLVHRAIDRYVRRLQAREAEVDHEDPLYSERRALRLTTASSTMGGAATVVIFTVALFVALAQFDISLGPLLAGAGIAGVALGFGAQNIVRDVLAGIFVIVEDQYGIGDVIDVGRASGTVESISLRMTRVRDIEGVLWFIPNGSLSEVGNKTQRWARVILDVDVAYGADHHEAGRLIKEAADEMWNDPDSPVKLLEEPELMGVEVLGESSVSIRIAVKSAPSDQWAAARELRGRIKDRFDAAGIEIPFPQRTVWVRREEGDPDARERHDQGNDR